MRIHHIGYLVKKIARAEQAFCALGYSREGEVTRDETRGIDILFMKNGETRVELVCPYCENSQVEGIRKRVGNAPYHICYLSEDIHKDAEEMQNQGYVLTSAPQPAPAIGGRSVAFLFSPAVGIVELVEA